MSNITRQPIYQKNKPPKFKTQFDGPERMSDVASLPCVICHEYGFVQLSRTEVHHCCHDRGSRYRAPDSMTIPLCNGHHTGDKDKGKLAIHKGKKTWRDKYGADYHWLSWVEERLIILKGEK